MAISCGHCGGEHDTVDDVRACSRTEHPPVHEPPRADVPPVMTVPAGQYARLSRLRRPPIDEVVSAPVGPGPDTLGRNVVIGAGQPVPAPWTDAPRVLVDPSVLGAPAAVVSLLRERLIRRERTVIELAIDLDAPPDETDRRPTHAIGPRGRLLLDELHHLVWSNSIDARGDVWRYGLLDAAVALGARPVEPGDAGDAVLADGTAVWLDGGPLRHCTEIDGVPVVPAVAVEHGALTPFGTNAVPDGVLAPDQLAAVGHRGGAARIIAPAGSGKTRVLTERARHLVTRWGLPPSAVSLVAYNRRAQQEMAERTTDVPGLQIRTLNGIALAIVNGARPFAPQPSTRRTIDEREVRRILGDLVEVPARRNQDPLAPWLEALRALRLELLSPHAVEDRFGGDVDGLAEVWPRFVARLDASGVVDFDHQIHLALGILLTDPVARRAAQRASRVLLVDEFQDLTPAHVLLIGLLAAPGGAVFGVGDDDQTIYGYQGADPGWLIDFAELFPGAGDHPLEINYRCPADVVTAAGMLLAGNERRVPKVLRAATAPATDTVRVPEVGGTAAPGAVAATVETTVQAVQDALDAGMAPSEVAVLTRVNSLLAPVQVALTARGVPVRGGPGAPFRDRTAVRSVLAWLRLGRPGAAFDRADLAEALRRPSRSLHPNVATWVTEQRSLDALLRLGDRVRAERDAERVREFAADIAQVAQAFERGASTAELVAIVARDLGVRDAVSTLDHLRRGTNAVAQSDDLLALEQVAVGCDDPSGFDAWLAQALGHPDAADGVLLATVHRVKGQEWPLVVVHQVDADQFPHRLADDVEEERRVFHVAITRAMRQVTLVADAASPSPFIAEMRGRAPAVPPQRSTVAGARQTARDAAQRDTKPRGADRSGSVARGSVSAGPAGGQPRRPREDTGVLAEADTVVAAVGLCLDDAGTWRITEVLDDGVVAQQGRAQRRFPFGAKVVTAGRQRGRLVAPASGVGDASARAYDLLRQMRERLRDGKPAYVVFNDATLERIAHALPRDLRALSRINGIGPMKLEQYGEAVLVAVEDALGDD